MGRGGADSILYGEGALARESGRAQAAEPGTKVRYLAEFQPQAWDGDYAVPVDPEGPTTWDCTGFVDDHIRDYLEGLESRGNGDLDDELLGVLDAQDRFQDDPAAPEWIRNWSGPFSIRVFRQTC